MNIDIEKIPEGWFIYGMGECVMPILYRHDAHENTGEGFWCELQHRTGGRLTRAKGVDLATALENAIIEVCRAWPDMVP
jgi:hypothetical protein